VRRIVGYGRFDGIEAAKAMARLYAAARLYVNFFQPSFKLKEKRREGAKVIKRYHKPLSPYERALSHPKVAKQVKRRLRAQYRTLDPVTLLAEIRSAQDELGNRIDRRARKLVAPLPVRSSAPDATTFAGGPHNSSSQSLHRQRLRPRRALSDLPCLWTARPMEGPPRPQSLRPCPASRPQNPQQQPTCDKSTLGNILR
jgi:hypothetical protein